MGALDQRAAREEFLESARGCGMGGQGTGHIVVERVAVGTGEQAVRDRLLEVLESDGRDFCAKSPGIAFVSEHHRYLVRGFGRDERRPLADRAQFRDVEVRSERRAERLPLLEAHTVRLGQSQGRQGRAGWGSGSGG
ncbi:hypothetical protein ACFQ6E_22470 [Streptomyces sp. NPDC056462]|uniref:hypothetical protein n=1 Tax=Streptomyces sp. NPDC056462 TaxID=3345826 RepID=UPI0036CC8B90